MGCERPSPFGDLGTLQGRLPILEVLRRTGSAISRELLFGYATIRPCATQRPGPFRGADNQTRGRSLLAPVSPPWGCWNAHRWHSTRLATASVPADLRARRAAYVLLRMWGFARTPQPQSQTRSSTRLLTQKKRNIRRHKGKPLAFP